MYWYPIEEHVFLSQDILSSRPAPETYRIIQKFAVFINTPKLSFSMLKALIVKFVRIDSVADDKMSMNAKWKVARLSESITAAKTVM